jgi:hypothetical protein
MAVKIRSASEIADKYSRVTPSRASEFVAGVALIPEGEFEQAAIAGEANYKTGIAASIAKGARAKGLAGSGKKWRSRIARQGESRFATGTADATGDFAEGFAPYRDTIANLTLPPRGPKGDPKNIERVRAVADALRKKKAGG